MRGKWPLYHRSPDLLGQSRRVLRTIEPRFAGSVAYKRHVGIAPRTRSYKIRVLIASSRSQSLHVPVSIMTFLRLISAAISQ